MAHHSTKNSPRARRAAFPLSLVVALGIATPCAWSAIVIEGTDAADVIDVSSSSMAHDIRGRGDDDRLTGSSAADAIDGGYGYDRMLGGDGADLLIGGPGNDIIDGGAGYRRRPVRKSPREPCDHWHRARAFQVRALDGSDGTDTLTGVEFVVFSDGRYSVADLLSPPGEPRAGRGRRPREHAARSVGRRRGARQRHGRRRGRPACDFRRRPRRMARRRRTPTVGDVCARCRIRRQRQLRLHGVRRTRRHRYGERVDHGVPRRSAGDALRSRIAAAPEGSWIKVNLNRYEDVWTSAAATRARERRATRRTTQDHHGLGLDDLGSESPSAHHLGRRSRATMPAMTSTVLMRQICGGTVPRCRARCTRGSSDRRFFTVDGALNAPISSHTYDNQEFLLALDRFITFGGASYNAGGSFMLDDGVTKTGPYLWDPSRAGANMVGGTTGSQVNPAIFPNVIGGRMWMNRNAIAVNGIGASRPGLVRQWHLGVRGRTGRRVHPRERVAAARAAICSATAFPDLERSHRSTAGS